VPDDHITACTNQFVIGEIDLADTNNFLASANILDVAIRNNLWSPSSGIPFNFLRTYSANRHESSWGRTRRVWRIFTLAAPSLNPFFSPYTDPFGTFGFGADLKAPYPFRYAHMYCMCIS
jgi:dipeptidase